MRRVAGLCMTVAVLALTVGSVTGREDKKPSLEGTYVIIGLEVGGKALPEADIAKTAEADRTIKITADKMVANRAGKEDSTSYKIDASKTPHEIDTIGKSPDGKAETSYGIYKIDGDKLIICVVDSEKATDRPKEFKTTADGKAMLMTLKKK